MELLYALNSYILSIISGHFGPFFGCVGLLGASEGTQKMPHCVAKKPTQSGNYPRWHLGKSALGEKYSVALEFTERRGIGSPVLGLSQHQEEITPSVNLFPWPEISKRRDSKWNRNAFMGKYASAEIIPNFLRPSLVTGREGMRWFLGTDGIKLGYDSEF